MLRERRQRLPAGASAGPHLWAVLAAHPARRAPHVGPAPPAAQMVEVVVVGVVKLTEALYFFDSLDGVIVNVRARGGGGRARAVGRSWCQGTWGPKGGAAVVAVTQDWAASAAEPVSAAPARIAPSRPPSRTLSSQPHPLPLTPLSSQPHPLFTSPPLARCCTRASWPSGPCGTSTTFGAATPTWSATSGGTRSLGAPGLGPGHSTRAGKQPGGALLESLAASSQLPAPKHGSTGVTASTALVGLTPAPHVPWAPCSARSILLKINWCLLGFCLGRLVARLIGRGPKPMPCPTLACPCVGTTTHHKGLHIPRAPCTRLALRGPALPRAMA
jgi:hypothetical protein